MTGETKASAALVAFLKRHRLTNSALADACGISKSVIGWWLDGKNRPSAFQRIILERITGGDVRAADWLTAEERKAIRAAKVMLGPVVAPAEAAA